MAFIKKSRLLRLRTVLYLVGIIFITRSLFTDSGCRRESGNTDSSNSFDEQQHSQQLPQRQNQQHQQSSASSAFWPRTLWSSLFGSAGGDQRTSRHGSEHDHDSYDGDLPLFRSRSWTINQHVGQYSTVLSVRADGYLLIESVFFVNDRKVADEPLEEVIKCYIRMRGTDHVIVKNATHVYKLWLFYDYIGADRMLKAKCELSKYEHRGRYADISVAIIDESRRPDEFAEFALTRAESDALIAYQRPVVYTLAHGWQPAPRLVHCVHMLRNIDSYDAYQKLLNWIELQRQLGVHSIRFYTLDVPGGIRDSLVRKYPRYVELVAYEHTVADVCRWHMRKMAQYPTSLVFMTLYKNCLNMQKRSITFNVYLQISSHENVCINDCILHAKYRYQYLTLYDIDELIFPRKVNPYESSRIGFEDAQCRRATFNGSALAASGAYSLYELASALRRAYGEETAYFELANVVYLTNRSQVADALRTFAFNKSAAPTAAENTFMYQNEDGFFKYTVDASDEKRVASMRAASEPLIKCREMALRGNGSGNGSGKLHDKWLQLFATAVFRQGKSILRPLLIEMADQHTGKHVVPGYRGVYVPCQVAFTNHFRDSLNDNVFGNFIKNETYNSYHFIMDVELLHFMIGLVSK